MSTTCLCTASAKNISSSTSSIMSYRSRRLDSSEAEASSSFLTNGAVDVAATTVLLSQSFADTFKAADDFTSVKDIGGVLPIFIMFAVILFGGYLLAVMLAWFTKSYLEARNSEQKSKEAPLLVRQTQRRSAILQNNGEAGVANLSPEATRKSLLNYIDVLLPAIYRGDSVGSGVLHELVRNHDYFGRGSLTETSMSVFNIKIWRLLTAMLMLIFVVLCLFDWSYQVLHPPEHDFTSLLVNCTLI
jgi:hypothetical protein